MNRIKNTEIPSIDFRLLLAWYRANRRTLPWREKPAPYAVWISEIMLQQTQVDTVLPYFERWMRRFPDLRSLADADLKEVLLEWEGLGYYSRARSLHRAAGIIRDQYRGELPADAESLRALPGIGPYTAGAIASIAFGLDEPLVDGNVRRVLSRIFDLSLPLDDAAGRTALLDIAESILPHGEAGDHNQALMELGALVCRPREPLCGGCPMQASCRSYAAGTQALRPVLRKKQPVPEYLVTAAVVRQDGFVLITQRPEDGLLGGLWEFPGGKVEEGETLEACLAREILEELGVEIQVGEALGEYRHAYTHFKVHLHAFTCRITAPDPLIQPVGVADYRWVRPDELESYPMGKIDRLISIDIRK